MPDPHPRRLGRVTRCLPVSRDHERDPDEVIVVALDKVGEGCGVPLLGGGDFVVPPFQLTHYAFHGPEMHETVLLFPSPGGRSRPHWERGRAGTPTG